MTSFDIETAAGTSHIELLDNPFVKKWTDHFSTMLGKYSVNYDACTIPVFNNTKSTAEILQDIENLKNNIININKLVDIFPFNPERVIYDNIFEDLHDRTSINYGSSVKYASKTSVKGQRILNEIHRYFTTAGRTLAEYEDNGIMYTGHWSDNFVSEFVYKEEDEDEFKHYLALMNDYVHDIDQSIRTPRKHNDLNKQIVNLEFSFTNQPDDCRFEKGAYVYITEEDYLYASDNEEYDVWLNKDILGKHYLEAFYDHDDPSEWDVTSINGHSGKFYINVESQWYEPNSLDNTIQQLIKRNDFQIWLKQYNIEYVPEICGIPLGKVTSGREFLIRKYYKSVHKQNFDIKVNN